MVDHVRSTWRVSIRRACRALPVERSTYHYRSRRAGQAQLTERIREIAATRVRYGYRRIHVLLRREGWRVNAKRVYRLYREIGLQLRNKTPKRLAIFEMPAGTRFGLHFEVKHPGDDFPSDKDQPGNYAIRAKCWVASAPKRVLPHTDAAIALVCSASRLDDYAPHTSEFKTIITFEDIAKSFPHAAPLGGRQACNHTARSSEVGKPSRFP
jgi:hypothetical protein